MKFECGGLREWTKLNSAKIVTLDASGNQKNQSDVEL